MVEFYVMKNEFSLETELDGKAFETHAIFTDFVLKKKWRRPVIWLGCLLTLSVICFILHEREGAVLLGGLFATLGILFPASYFLAYFIGLKRQSDKIDRDVKKIHYITTVNNEGFTSGFGKISWETVDKIYFYQDYIYVYLEKQTSFLLPGTDKELCDFIKTKIKVAEK